MEEEIQTKLTNNLLEMVWLIQSLQKKSPMNCCNLNATSGQGRILSLLKLNDNLKSREIAKLLHMNISSVNEFINKLIKKGYIERFVDSADKRVRRIRLTEKGQKEVLSDPMNDNIFENFTLDDKQEFDQLILKINHNLKNELDHYINHLKSNDNLIEIYNHCNGQCNPKLFFNWQK